MADYIYLDDYSNRGKLGISYRVFDQLVTECLMNVKGIAKSQKHLKRNQFIPLNRPVQTYIVRGIVHIWIYIDVVKGTDVRSVVEKIQGDVYNSLMIITEQVPINVQVKVESII